MLKKAILLFFLLFFNTMYPLGLTTSTHAQSPSQNTELTFVSNNIVITPSNLSEITLKTFFVGDILGGNTIYNIRAGFYINGNYVVRLSFVRDDVIVSIELSKVTPDFNGSIYFPTCCSNVLKPLRVSIAISNSTKALNDPNFQLYLSYTVLTTNLYRGLVSKNILSSVNALGYPYPPREFVIGLMVTLIGILPVYIIDKVLLRFSRR